MPAKESICWDLGESSAHAALSFSTVDASEHSMLALAGIEGKGSGDVLVDCLYTQLGFLRRKPGRNNTAEGLGDGRSGLLNHALQLRCLAVALQHVCCCH